MADPPAPLLAFATAPPAAVTFDFWDTLVRADAPATRARRRQLVVEVLEVAGAAERVDGLDAALAASAEAFGEAWRANRQFTAEDGAMVVIRALGIEHDHDLAEQVLVAFARAGHGLRYELAPGIAGTLDALVAADVPVGIICDVGMTPSDVLRSYLEVHGVLDRFRHWSFSDEVGVFKPDPTIFEHALAGLDAPDPSRVAHVGDLVRTDIAGARGMGMVAIRYAGITDDAARGVEGGPESDHDEARPEAHAVLAHHDELPGLLGLVG